MIRGNTGPMSRLYGGTQKSSESNAPSTLYDAAAVDPDLPPIRATPLLRNRHFGWSEIKNFSPLACY